MASITRRGATVHTVGELPAVGSTAPAFTLTGTDMRDVTRPEGVRTVLNIFPSVDTGTCATSVRTFNKLAADLADTHVICVSADLPYALSRFCGAEGIDKVTTASSFRSTFGTDYGMTMTSGDMRGLLARSVVVLDRDGTVLHTQLVPDIGQEPDYEAALAALGTPR
ncbi:MAG TPA: thiol peroxidase [Intrasporangium sp.]|uniref:thiol peroxidase n=1 Tax=Intrasporangium sp. TaxID=1925024 RepID=UPI002D7761A5|nr:thiol peroxidase [Intrasporangium sp.]HET7398846.1 thiol peroxidase [Intrasporangium sp.]